MMKSITTVCAGIIALGLCMSCAHGGEHTDADNHGQTEADGHSDEIVYKKKAAEEAGVRTEPVGRSQLSGVVLASGKIVSASSDETVLVANVSGIVHFRKSISEGMKVEKGSTLFVLSSAHIQDGDPAERASVAYETARKDYERAAKLVGDKIISEKEFNAIKGVYEEARIAYLATANSRQANGTAVTVPANGYVKSCVVSEGDYVTAGQPLVRIACNEKLYLRADVAARHFSILDKITKAKFSTSYSDSIYDTEKLHGRLLSYGRAVDDATGYVPVVFELENNGTLLSGAFADVYLLTDEGREVVSLPLSAITEEQGVKFVYVQQDADCYRKQEVKLGISDGERVEVLAGVNVGDKVVTQGAIRVKLAAAGNAIPAHTHNH